MQRFLRAAHDLMYKRRLELESNLLQGVDNMLQLLTSQGILSPDKDQDDFTVLEGLIEYIIMQNQRGLKSHQVEQFRLVVSETLKARLKGIDFTFDLATNHNISWPEWLRLLDVYFGMFARSYESISLDIIHLRVQIIKRKLETTAAQLTELLPHNELEA